MKLINWRKQYLESDLEWRHPDLSVRWILLVKAQLAPRPVIVRDESGRLFLEAALPRESPFHRPPLIVQQTRKRRQAEIAH